MSPLEVVACVFYLSLPSSASVPPAPEEPLSTLQADFQLQDPDGQTYTMRGCSLLHRLVSEGALATLERRRDQLTPALLAATCTVRKPSNT